jgi:hypothetical protein
MAVRGCRGSGLAAGPAMPGTASERVAGIIIPPSSGRPQLQFSVIYEEGHRRVVASQGSSWSGNSLSAMLGKNHPAGGSRPEVRRFPWHSKVFVQLETLPCSLRLRNGWFPKEQRDLCVCELILKTCSNVGRTGSLFNLATPFLSDASVA